MPCAGSQDLKVLRMSHGLTAIMFGGPPNAAADFPYRCEPGTNSELRQTSSLLGFAQDADSAESGAVA